MRQWTGHLLIIVAVSTLVLFTNLGSARLWDRDEPRNAGCAVEMMERGNLVGLILARVFRTAGRNLVQLTWQGRQHDLHST